MQYNHKQVLIKLVLFVLVFTLMVSVVSAALNVNHIQNDISCSSNIFSLRFLGVDTGLDTNGPGITQMSPWVDFFNSNSYYSNVCLPGFTKIQAKHNGNNEGSILMGGFLYITEPIDGQLIKSRGFGKPNVKYMWVDFSVVTSELPGQTIFSLTNLFTSTSYSTFKNLLSPMSQTYVYGNVLKSRSDSWKTEEKFHLAPLKPGVYFLQAGVETEYKGSRDLTDTTELYPVRFGAETGYDVDSNLNHISTTGYAITNRLLTLSEMNSYMGDAIESEADLCTFVGGDHKVNDSVVGICCGNKDSDLNMVSIFGGKEQRCVFDGSWYWNGDKSICEDENPKGVFQSEAFVSPDANDGTDGCCGDDSFPTSCQPTDAAKETTSSCTGEIVCTNHNSDVAGVGCTPEGLSFGCKTIVTAGSWCVNPDWTFTNLGEAPDCSEITDLTLCPDECTKTVVDPASFGCESLSLNDCSSNTNCEIKQGQNGDFGYINADRTFMCNGDLADDDFSIALEGAPKWWDANDRYQIHTNEGTDYVSNGDEWFECSSANYGGGIPLATTLDPTDSCTSMMNLLATLPNPQNDNKLYFDGIDTDDTKLFSESEANGGDRTCYPDVFEANNIFSCLNNCFIGSNAGTVYANLIEYESTIVNDVCTQIPTEGCTQSTSSSSITNFNVCSASNTCFQDYDSDLDCGDFKLSEPPYVQGSICNQELDYCKSNEFLLSGDTIDVADSVCCVTRDETIDKTDLCQSQPKTVSDAITCNEDYFGDYRKTIGDHVCNSPFGSVDGCCLSGKWELGEEIYLQSTNTPNEAFTCAESFNENRFLECCGTDADECFNYNAGSLLSDKNTNNIHSSGVYVTPGSSTYYIQNWDVYDEKGVLQNLGLRVVAIQNNPATVYIDPTDRTRNDWNGYDNVEFDISYGVDKLTNIAFYDGANEVFNQPIHKYMADGTGINDEHHVVIPLNSPVAFTSKDRITSFKIFVDNAVQMSIGIDNIYLSKDDGSSQFCAGDFKEWVNNLDGPSDEGFASVVEAVEYGPYSIACDAISSFGWTGQRCCGDDTRFETQEYFTDSTSGCYQGNLIRENELVSDVMNVDELKDILYYEGEFHQCGGFSNDKKITYSRSEIEGNLITLFYSVGAPVGSRACEQTDTGYEWVVVPQLECESRGYDYLTDDMIDDNPVLPGGEEYNTTTIERCCAQGNIAAGETNGALVCNNYPSAESGEQYKWESNIFADCSNPDFPGDILANYKDYTLEGGSYFPDTSACCYLETVRCPGWPSWVCGTRT